ncbi:MAG: VOC family protein [Candidatus Dormibacteria bacterium]
MFIGAHTVFYTPDAERARAFFREVLGLPSVDTGGGWLIFALPPAEVAAHPVEGPPRTELYLLCDDIEATVSELRSRGAEFAGPVTEESWGLVTSILVPGGGELGLYQPLHARPHWAGAAGGPPPG